MSARSGRRGARLRLKIRRNGDTEQSVIKTQRRMAMGNYRLAERRELPDIGAEGFLYEHVSGAKAVHIKRGDDNKLFAAVFRTPSRDSAGTAHIVEHCVLSGSKDYPAKDTFNELAKGSLHTFLNAMTYRDFTAYPVGSRNEKDFYNLMSVYLDAVFAPLIYDRKWTFMREGWHFEPENGGLAYNGVVYNEMKGAYSNPDDNLEELTFQTLFPDSALRFSSGGDPEKIPSLTYADFLDFHKIHYVPGNCFLIFYGDMDIEKCLNLAENWLNRFGKTEPVFTADQPAFAKPAFASGKYSAEAGGKPRLSAAYVFGSVNDAKLCVGGELLTRILLKTEASSLKRALAHLGAEVTGEFEDSLPQPVFRIIVKDAAADARGLIAAVNRALAEIAENGPDPALVESVLTRYEFERKEEDFGWFPKGLMYGLSAALNWRSGGDAFALFSQMKIIGEIRAEGAGYFAGLIKRFMLDNPHACAVELEPDAGLENRRAESAETELAEKRRAMTREEFAAAAEAAKKLKEYSDAPDSPEALAAIPLLSREDVRVSPGAVLCEPVSGRFHADYDANGITYAEILFDADLADPAIGACVYLLGKMDTRRTGYAELSNRAAAELGGLEFSAEAWGGPVIRVSAKALENAENRMFDIIREIILETDFSDAARAKKLLAECRAKLENQIQARGDVHALSLAESKIFPNEAWKQAVGGVTFYRWLKDALNDFDERYPALKARFEEISARLFTRGNAAVYSGFAKKRCAAFDAAAKAFEAALPKGAGRGVLEITPKFGHEAVYIVSQVQYCAQAADYRGIMPYSGHMRVLAGALSDGYLMKELRIKGGAYGAFCSFSRDGAFRQYSYRDPGAGSTFRVFDNSAAAARAFDEPEREVTKYVLGAINALDRPLSGARKLAAAVQFNRLGVTMDDLRKEREEILSAKAGDLRRLGERLSALSYARAVVGGEPGIAADAAMFGISGKL
jgi:Zn-dependent M16 (insulinase) family peptidase